MSSEKGTGREDEIRRGRRRCGSRVPVIPGTNRPTPPKSRACPRRSLLFLQRRHVPQQEDVVDASGGQRLAVRREGDRVNGVLVAAERLQEPTSADVPEANG